MSKESTGQTGTRLPDAQLPPLRAGNGERPAAGNPMNLINDMALDLRVVLGNATLTCEKLLNMKQGEIIELDRRVDQPVDLFVGEELVARGRLVAAGDQYGVQVEEVFFSV